MNQLALTVNGKQVNALVAPRTHLADFLREARHLTGTNLGCEQGVCGACTVMIDSVPARSCIIPAVSCHGVAGPASVLPVGWTASFYKEGGVCLSVYNDRRAERRLFLILRVTNGTRHIYVLEAQRLRQNESYSILICEERHGLELSDHLFSNWLSRFPYAGGTHWVSFKYDDLALISMPAIHQPHRGGQTDEVWFRFYIERMQGKVASFVDGRADSTTKCTMAEGDIENVLWRTEV